MDLGDAQELWDPEPGWLNTASYGLPPRPGWEALQAALADWRRGRVSWKGWNDATDRSRAAFARLVGVDAADVTVGATVSQLLAPLAAALPDGARVLAPEIEFTSSLFPWLAQAGRGVTTRTVAVDKLVDAVDAETDLVAVDVPGAEAKLERAGVRAAVRAGRIRASFHVYTTDADVDLALNALAA
jgi:selenocysteine lyase/cysteine desulfurase